MQIAIVGTGAIGSVFAFQLARAGHDVTVVARGERLAQLERERAIVLASGERGAVTVRAELDTSVPYDLLLVTVLAPQLASVMPAICASAARKVMIMHNTFDPIAPLREAIGADRFSFGFPAGVLAILKDGVITPQIRSGTTADDAALAQLFTRAGIPTLVEKDMQSWLRSHAALVIPLMSLGVRVHASGAGVSWAEAMPYAEAMRQGFAIVRTLGHPILPSAIGAVSRMPRAMLTAILWALSRTKMLRDLGALGAQEARMLTEMMTRAAPGRTNAIRALAP